MLADLVNVRFVSSRNVPTIPTIPGQERRTVKASHSQIPGRIEIALRIPECIFPISEGLFGKDHGRVGVHRQSHWVGQVHVLEPVVIDLYGRESERGERET